MTRKSDFDRAFTEFRALVYPDYPESEDLRNWNSELLTIDSHVAGYLSRVYSGSMSAHDFPDIDQLVLDIESLHQALGEIKPESGKDRKLIGEYGAYVAALEVALKEVFVLATEA